MELNYWVKGVIPLERLTARYKKDALTVASNSHFEQGKGKNSDLPAHEVFDSLRSQSHRNSQHN